MTTAFLVEGSVRMDDVDEGFGSNESNLSPTQSDSTVMINEIKHLNGQCVTGEGKNGISVSKNDCDIIRNDCINVNRNYDVCKEDGKLGKKSEDCNVVSERKLLDEDSPCIDFKEVLRAEQDVAEDNDTCYPASKAQKNTVENTKTNGVTGNVRIDEDIPKESGCEKIDAMGDAKEVKVDEIKTTETVDLTDHSDLELLENSVTDDNLTKQATTDCIDSSEYTEKTNIESQNVTPVKQRTSTADGAKSPFLLDEKVRNSLKGLVNKVKSSELSKDGSSPMETITENAATTDVSTTTSFQDNKKEHSVEMKSRIENSEKTSDNVLTDYDDDEGMSMEIGSDNEDLLELSSEDKNGTAKSARAMTPLSVTGDKADNNLVEISDNEDEEIAENQVNSKKNSDETIQFEEDSNSNFTAGSSGKISDIVNFLNHDLSGSNSPLTVKNSSDSESKINSISKDNEKVLPMETEDTELKEKETTQQVSGTINIGNSTSAVNTENTENGIPCTETAKCTTEISLMHKDLSKSSKSSILDETLTKNGDINGDSEDDVANIDDDDVIFEGETKAESQQNNANLKEPKTLPEIGEPSKRYSTEEKSSDSTDKALSQTRAGERMAVESNSLSKGCGEDIVDDDVIFEKETKLEHTASKQNCDISKPSSEVQSQNTYSSVDKNADDKEGEQSVDKQSEEVVLEMSRDSFDRKRSADGKAPSENEPKRSRLDLSGLIGKLGSRVEPARIEVSDSEDEIMTSATNTAEEQSSTEQEEENNKPKQKLITLTEKELEDIVREKVKVYLTSQRDTLITKLSKKVKELQLNNDLWKRQVKDLQVKVNDVTVLQQKQERRKAATAALRQITTRNVAVQVEDGRTANIRNRVHVNTGSSRAQASQPPLVQTPGSNGTIRLPVSQSTFTLPVMPHNLQQGKMVTTAYQTPSVKSLLDTTRVQKTIGSPSQTATTVTSVLSILQAPSSVLAKTTLAQGVTQQVVTTQAVTPTVAPAKTVTLTSPTAKVIDLTEDDESSKARLVSLPPGINTITNQGIRHVLPPGAQLVRSGPNQPTYQLVFNPAASSSVMMSVQSTMPKTTTLLQTVQPSQNVINLTSPSQPSATTLTKSNAVTVPKVTTSCHPAPFPDLPTIQLAAGLKALPPKPSLRISRVSQGIVLSWNMALCDTVAEISNYQLFAYQETSAPPTASLWKKVGDVKALPLPMACTLTQFQVGNKYHFAVRAMDVHSRVGSFSDPSSIHLTPTTAK